MFATFERTWEITKICWGILRKDRELVLFPIFSGVAIVLLAVLVAGVGGAAGSFERLGSENPQAALQGGDIILALAAYFVLSFIVVYFNVALVGAAMIRIRGGDPTVSDGIRIASRRIPQIAGWAIVTATVGLLLRLLRDQARDNMFGQIIVSILGGIWAYLTFFVVPILVVEGLGPIGAIRRSGALFKQTWGEQFVSNFGFGLLFFVAVVVGFIPAALLGSVSPLLGLGVGVVTVGTAAAIVSSLEGIFKAALYEYAAENVVAGEFSQDLLAQSYVPRRERGGYI